MIERLADWSAARRDLLWLSLILLLAVLLRVWQLYILPPGLLASEAELSLAARDVSQVPVDLGLSLFVYLQAITQQFMDPGVLAVRAVPVLLGVFSVLMIFMAARTWLSEKAALAAAFFMAVSSWSLHLTRLSEPVAVVLVLLPLHIWLWGKALDTHHAAWYVLTGISLGLFAYTVIPVWLLFMAILVFGLFMYAIRTEEFKQHLQPLLIVLLSGALALMPAVLYMMITGDLAPIRNEWQQLQALGVLVEQPMESLMAVVSVLGMFHYEGSEQATHNLPGQPHLNGVLGVLFVLGVLIALRRRKQTVYAGILILACLLLLPALAAVDTAPDPVMAAFMLPVITVLAGIGLEELFRRWRTVFPRNLVAGSFALAVIALSLGGVLHYETQHYFRAWANTPEVIETFNEDVMAAVAYTGQRPGQSGLIIEREGSSELLEYLLTSDEITVTNTNDFTAGRVNDYDYIIDLSGSVVEQAEVEESETITSVWLADTALFEVHMPVTDME